MHNYINIIEKNFNVNIKIINFKISYWKLQIFKL